MDTDRRSSLSSENMTLAVFMHEVLPLLRNIRTHRIIQGGSGYVKVVKVVSIGI